MIDEGQKSKEPAGTSGAMATRLLQSVIRNMLMSLEKFGRLAALSAVALAAAATASHAAITITKAEISAGQLVVKGTRTGTAPSIVLDNQFTSGVVSGAFAFSLTYLPPDCIVDLKSDGGTGGSISAVVANCGPRGLSARGPWSSVTVYLENDVVTDSGSSFRAKRTNTGKTPASSGNDWEVLAAKGARGIQGATGVAGATGATGATGNDGAPGPQGIQGVDGDTGQTGAQGPQGVQGPAGTSAVVLKGTGPQISTAVIPKFFGPTTQMTIAATDRIAVTNLKLGFQAASNGNIASAVHAALNLCFRKTDTALLTFFLDVPYANSLTVLGGGTNAFSDTVGLAAAKPDVAGTYEVGLCIVGDTDFPNLTLFSINIAGGVVLIAK